MHLCRMPCRCPDIFHRSTFHLWVLWCRWSRHLPRALTWGAICVSGIWMSLPDVYSQKARASCAWQADLVRDGLLHLDYCQILDLPLLKTVLRRPKGMSHRSLLGMDRLLYRWHPRRRWHICSQLYVRIFHIWHSSHPRLGVRFQVQCRRLGELLF